MCRVFKIGSLLIREVLKQNGWKSQMDVQMYEFEVLCCS
jgi:hypothetical protein